jgi:uncharacterized Zn finger protein (UPF0148 family)
MLYTIHCSSCKHSFRRISTNPEGPGTVSCPECTQEIKVESSSQSNHGNTNESKSSSLNNTKATCSDEEFT